MLHKLALTGIKSRLRDYLVLFAGLVVSSTVFYMFEALATNPEFLKNSTNGLNVVSFIFQIGSVLLTIISLVYIFYANSFLLSMRQHDYGMFLVLGAKPKKIGRLILTETMLVGVFSSLIGVILGCILTSSVGTYMMQIILHNKIQNFQPIYLPAVFATLILYVVLFLLAGLINRRKLVKTSVLELLKGDSQPNRPQLNPWSQAIQVIAGLLLLTSGYFTMAHLLQFQGIGIVYSLIVIVAGTYFLFNAVLVWLIVLLKKTGWAQRGLNNFTLSQLSFRIRNYTKILSTVSILFALALGAITVAMGFGKEIEAFSQGGSAYTMALENPDQKVKQQIAELNLDKRVDYSQKETNGTVYYNQDEFNQTPLQNIPGNWARKSIKGETQKVSFENLDGVNIQNNTDALSVLQKGGFNKQVKVVSAREFSSIKVPEQKLYLFRVKDVQKSQGKLDQITKTLYPNSYEKMRLTIPGGYSNYLHAQEGFGGFEFMGFFLGIAFLAMLASCLMFKILSGANSDQQRYEMLNKLGVRQRILRQSISREIIILYALPGILGIVDVLFGLQMFKSLMLSPYGGIWLSFLIFIVLYLAYYIVTVKLYEQLVLPQLKINK